MNVPGPVVAIVGPTAVGKSALADMVAQKLASEVISIDAMQVYTGMDIGTAKTPADKRIVPLHMVDVVSPKEPYSVQQFQCGARACIDKLLERGCVPVLCGGTGLYLNAVIDEMTFPPGEQSHRLRQKLQGHAQVVGAGRLYQELQDRDPESAALIHPNNTRRVIRALELYELGESYARQHDGLHNRSAHYRAHIWGLTLSRERLYKRINERVDEMLRAGLIEEVCTLVNQGMLSADTTAGQAIGYKEFLEYFSGSVDKDVAVEEIRRHSRRYAKRQLSWFRHDSRVKWINLDKLSTEQAAKLIVEASI